MVTDLTHESSLLLCFGEGRIVEAITYPRVGDGLYEMKGVLSRKKQVLPYLLELIRSVV
jgi:manganese-dependent inorganic pyrophosphatase